MDARLRPMTSHCAGTGQPLTPGEAVRSVLVDHGDETQRFDYTDAGWNGPPEDALAVWRATVPHPAAKKAGLDIDEQFARFEQLAEEDAPHQAPLTYVLGLWLMRRRRLRIDGTFSEDRIDRLTLAGTRGEGPFHVRDQQLGRDQIDALQAALFEGPDAASPHAEAA